MTTSILTALFPWFFSGPQHKDAEYLVTHQSLLSQVKRSY